MGLYACLARLLEYPDGALGDRVQEAAAALSAAVRQHTVPTPDGPVALRAITQFGAEAARLGLAAMQEIYTSAFDLDERCTLYVGHHLLTATARRGAFMARLAEEYLQSGFACPDHELPDHLAVMLRYVDEDANPVPPTPERDEVHREMIAALMLPATQRILQALEADGNPYRFVMRALVAEMEQQPAAGREATV